MSAGAPTGLAQTPCSDVDGRVRTAVSAVNDGRIQDGERILEEVVDRCPDHLGGLRELAGLRFRQTRWTEAEELALRAAALAPEAEWPWDVAGSSRYLAQNRIGALEMWNRIHRPQVEVVDLRWADTGRRAPFSRAAPVPGEILTGAHLARTERRLVLTPGVSRVRVDYRPLPGGTAAVDGHLLAEAPHPFVRSAWSGHLARGVSRSFLLVGTPQRDLALRGYAGGHLGAWGREVATGVQHPLPLSHGAVEWSVRWTAADLPVADTVARRERVSAGVGVRRWETSTVQSHVQLGADRWIGRDAMLRAGAGLLLARPEGGPAWIGMEATGWREAGGDGYIGRVSAAAHRARGRQWQVEARSGAGMVSTGAPADLLPRFGSDPSVDRLVRSRNVVAPGPLDTGGQWIHGGLEIRRWWSAGPGLHLGLGVFAEGVAGTFRSGALGAGVRLRPLGAGSWLRVDWAMDPRGGGHRLSLGITDACGLSGHLPFSLPPCTVGP